LSEIELRNRNLGPVSYYSSYEQINPAVNDSVFKAEGKVWLQPVKADSIFGSVFHVQGIDGGGSFDYYYDGTKSYEIRHDNKTVKLIDPYKFENNANNPAKARTALSPLVHELTDTNISVTLRKNNPVIDLAKGKDTYLLTLKYPSNEYGQEETVRLYIKKKTFIIGKIQKKLNWQGIEYSTTIEIDTLQIYNPDILNKIYLQNTYPDYSTSELTRDNNDAPDSDFTGLKARNFVYPVSENDSINLENLRGKYVLLDFWETWCGHCILSLPEIQKLQDRYKPELTVIGITTENRLQVEKLLRNNKLTYINIFADQKILSDYGVTGRPVYFLLDKEGIILEHTEGDLGKIKSVLKDLRDLHDLQTIRPANHQTTPPHPQM